MKPTLVNMRNCQILLFMHVKYCRKIDFVEHVWSKNSAMFTYVSTHCVETVKQLDYNWYSQLTRWYSGTVVTHLIWVQEFPDSIPGTGKGFYVHVLCFCCCDFTFCLNTLFVTRFCNSFCNVNFVSIFNIFARFVTDYTGEKIQT